MLAFSAAAKAQSPQSNDNKWPYKTSDEAPLLAVVGDVSCQPGEAEAGEAANETCVTPKAPYTSTTLWQSQEATANLIVKMKPNSG
jgi:hypothetical protein